MISEELRAKLKEWGRKGGRSRAKALKSRRANDSNNGEMSPPVATFDAAHKAVINADGSITILRRHVDHSTALQDINKKQAQLWEERRAKGIVT